MTIDARRRTALSCLQAWDIFIFLLCALYALHASGHIVSSTAALQFSIWLIASCAAWHISLSGCHVYRSRRLVGTVQTREILFGVSLATGCTAALALLLLQPVTVPVLAAIWALSLISTVASRAVIHRVLRLLRRRGRNLRFAILIGSGRRAEAVLKPLKDPQAGYCLIGYIDDREDAQWARANNLKYLGTLNELSAALGKQVVDEVFVALPMRSCYDGISQSILDCKSQGIPVRMPLDFFPLGPNAEIIDSLEGASVVSFLPSHPSLSYLFAKRTLDIIVAACALLVLWPLLVVAALAVRIDSAGPALFLQRRVGLNKRTFTLIKFRTMHVNSEAMIEKIAHLNEARGPVFKIRDDPRVTRVGRFLRQTSIDELPQLINVLIGDMSLVGPRPLPLRDVAGFTIDWQRRRFSVRPGITCLWQISGRSSLSFDQWMSLDMDYIDKRSLVLDFQILLMTVPAVFTRRGAY